MANTKISELAELTSAASGDLLPIVDVSAGATKKVKPGNLVIAGAKELTRGTQSAPAVAFGGATDASTGIYSPGDEQVAISTGGTQRISIGSDGDINIDSGGVFYDASTNRLAVGTMSPSEIFDCQPSSTLGFSIGRDPTDSTKLALRSYQGSTNNNVRSISYIGSDHRFQVGAVTGTTASEVVRIDSSGRLLVGTSSWSGNAAAVFSGVGGGTGSGNVHIGRGSVNLNNNQPQGFLWFTDKDENQFAYIGCWTDAAGTTGTNTPGRLVFSTTADGASSPTERMRISEDGKVLIGNTSGIINTTSFGTRMGSLGAEGVFFTARNVDGTDFVMSVYGNAGQFRIVGNGDALNTNNSYGALSDIKLKENIVDANSQWDDIKALQVRNYNFKEGQTHTQIGLIAQEVELVSPGLVSQTIDRDEDDNDLGTVTKSVNYSVLYMKAVKALQEAMERIETLETEMAAVKAQLG